MARVRQADDPVAYVHGIVIKTFLSDRRRRSSGELPVARRPDAGRTGTRPNASRWWRPCAPCLLSTAPSWCCASGRTSACSRPARAPPLPRGGQEPDLTLRALRPAAPTHPRPDRRPAPDRPHHLEPTDPDEQHDHRDEARLRDQLGAPYRHWTSTDRRPDRTPATAAAAHARRAGAGIATLAALAVRRGRRRPGARRHRCGTRLRHRHLADEQRAAARPRRVPRASKAGGACPPATWTPGSRRCCRPASPSPPSSGGSRPLPAGGPRVGFINAVVSSTAGPGRDRDLPSHPPEVVRSCRERPPHVQRRLTGTSRDPPCPWSSARAARTALRSRPSRRLHARCSRRTGTVYGTANAFDEKWLDVRRRRRADRDPGPAEGLRNDTWVMPAPDHRRAGPRWNRPRRARRRRTRTGGSRSRTAHGSTDSHRRHRARLDGLGTGRPAEDRRPA